jgi:hypothetical protein
VDRRNLTEAAGTFRRGDSDSTMIRMRRETGEALLGPLRNRRRNEALYNRHHREVRESREGDGRAGSSGEAEQCPWSEAALLLVVAPTKREARVR